MLTDKGAITMNSISKSLVDDEGGETCARQRERYM